MGEGRAAIPGTCRYPLCACRPAAKLSADLLYPECRPLNCVLRFVLMFVQSTQRWQSRRTGTSEKCLPGKRGTWSSAVSPHTFSFFKTCFTAKVFSAHPAFLVSCTKCLARVEGQGWAIPCFGCGSGCGHNLY